MASNIPCKGKYCGKGVQIKLSRFFPVKKGKAPEIPKDLTANLPHIGEGFHYSLSTLRSGYIYTFNDARGSWDGYFVTESKDSPKLLRFLANMSDAEVSSNKLLGDNTQAKFDAKFFASCECNKDSQKGKPKAKAGPDIASVLVNHTTVGAVATTLLGKDRAMAAAKTAATTVNNANKHQELVNINTITLEGNPEQYTSLYYVFSDTEWTTENFKKVIKSRSSYMQKVNLQQIIKEQANKIYNALLVYDPMGIAAELNNHVQRELSMFNQSLENNFNHWRCDAVDAIKTAIERGAATSYYDDVLMTSGLGKKESLIPGIGNRDYWRLNMVQGVNANPIKGVYASKDHLDKTIAKSWAKYEKDVDRGTYNSIRNTSKEKAEAVNKRLAVLDAAIVATLTHSRTKAYFEHSFDKNKHEHGTALTGVIGSAIEHTGDLDKCSTLYKTWLTDESMDNPLWRALTSDSIKLASEVKKASVEEGTLEFLVNKFDWKNAFSVYGEWAAVAGTKTLTDRYVHKIASGVSGPLSQMVFNGTTPKIAARALFILGVHGEVRVRFNDIPGLTSLGAARQILLNTLIAEATDKAGKELSNNAKKGIAKTVGDAKARAHFAEELLARYQGRGLKLTDTGKIKGMAIIPKNGVNGTTIVSHAQVESLSKHTPKTAIFGILSLIAYGVFFNSSWKSFSGKASLSAKDQAEFTSTIFYTLGAFSGTVGKFIDAYTSQAAFEKIASGKGPAAAKGLSPSFMSSQSAIRKLSIGGSLFGGVGGVLLGVVEFCNVAKELKSGNMALAILHTGVAVSSGFVGIVSLRQAYVVYRGGDAALVRGARLTFWFIIIAIILSLWIEWIKRNDPDPLQKWLQDNGFNKGSIAKAEKSLQALFTQVDGNGLTYEQALANYRRDHGTGD